MAGTFDEELARLNRTLAMYVRASGKTVDEVLVKKSGQLGYALRQEFRGLMPAKGQVRRERIAALKAGEGLHVRPRVYELIAQKYGALPLAAGVMKFRAGGRRAEIRGTTRAGLNLQALAVKRELALRESGRGFLGQSSKFAFNEKLTQEKALSRYGAWLAVVGLRKWETGSEVVFKWGGLSTMSDEAVKGIGRARGLKAMARAMSVVSEDMGPYIKRKLEGNG